MIYSEIVNEYPSREEWKEKETPYIQVEKGKDPRYNYKPWNEVKFKSDGSRPLTFKFNGNPYTIEETEGSFEFMDGELTSLSNAFSNQTTIEEIDVSNLDTSNVTYFGSMFQGTSKLNKIIGLKDLVTSAATDIGMIFAFVNSIDDCSEINSWNVSNLTTIYGLFSFNPNIQTVDVSDWDVSNVKEATFAFFNCTKLERVGDLSNWNTSNMTTIGNIFMNCYALTSIGDLSKWDVSKIKYLASIFSSCLSLTSVGDLSNWDTSNNLSLEFMFGNCYALSSVGDLSDWDTSNVTTMYSMFQSCRSLTSVGDLSNWSTSNVQNMAYMFNGYDKNMLLTNIGDLSNWNTSNVTDTRFMFSRCVSLTSVGNLSKWDVSKVKDMQAMFQCCQSLKELNLSNWNTSNVTNFKNFLTMDAEIDIQTCLETLYLDGWTIKSTANTDYMFSNCRKLKTIYARGCDETTISKLNSLKPSGCTLITE